MAGYMKYRPLSSNRILLIATAMGMSFFAHADDMATLPKGLRLTDSMSNGAIQMSGTVILPPPCKVNNDQPLEVEFNNVRTDLIDGESYASQPVPVVITCDGNPSSQLQIEMRGTAEATDDSVLQTTVPGLGIALRRDGSKFSLNSKTNVSKTENFVLTAIPTRTDVEKLSAGEFTATATLIVAQQ